jgi:hypothetical protein
LREDKTKTHTNTHNKEDGGGGIGALEKHNRACEHDDHH